MGKKAVVLFSGGMDSTTCLAIAQAQGFSTYALSFDYGQRHLVELAAAKKIAQALKATAHKIIPLALDELGGSALTDKTMPLPNYVDDGKIPTTYIPARNTIFLALALSYAEVLGAQAIFIGVSAVDYSGYPDCRREYIAAFQQLANLATKAGVEGNGVTLYTPLLSLSKAQTILVGTQLGIDYRTTVTCYQADQQGRACGRCASCVLRKKGFAEADLIDMTHYFTT